MLGWRRKGSWKFSWLVGSGSFLTSHSGWWDINWGSQDPEVPVSKGWEVDRALFWSVTQWMVGYTNSSHKRQPHHTRMSLYDVIAVEEMMPSWEHLIGGVIESFHRDIIRSSWFKEAFLLLSLRYYFGNRLDRKSKVRQGRVTTWQRKQSKRQHLMLRVLRVEVTVSFLVLVLRIEVLKRNRRPALAAFVLLRERISHERIRSRNSRRQDFF